MGLSVRAQNIRKSYGTKEVLKGITFDFMPNKVYALMGPNGSGKTTLLRTLGLLDQPDSGSVIYTDGAQTPLEHTLGLMRRITLLLPGGGLFNSSVFLNASYGLRVRGLPSKKVKELAMEALKLVGLKDKSKQNALSLSSGEARRLCIARALALDPEVLFLDEPTASVDSASREAIEEIISGTRDSRSIVLSTHDPDEAQRLADTVIYLQDGLLIN